MSESPHEELRAQLNIDDAGRPDAEVQGYKDRQLAALELDTRIALTEAARNAALIRRFRKIGLSKALAQYTVLRHLSSSHGHRMTHNELGQSERGRAAACEDGQRRLDQPLTKIAMVVGQRSGARTAGHTSDDST